jgi:hypothetical protein
MEVDSTEPRSSLVDGDEAPSMGRYGAVLTLDLGYSIPAQ